MAYGRFYKRKTRMVAVKPNSARKYSTPRKKYSKTPKITFAKKVNEIIARNVENKMTTSFTTTDSLCTRSLAGVFSWFLVSNWNVKLFTLPQGAAQQQRIGNQIRLKRWIIKGLLHPPSNVSQTFLANTFQGYVTIYFGRLLTNEELTNTLTDLYENGNSSQTPAGTMAQIFKTINKDKYKVYYQKTFKLAPAMTQPSVGQSSTLLANNDFSLVRTFGFDVTKYICKNSIIKYNDSNNDPNNAMIRQLGIWATWQPAVGDIGSAINVDTSSYYNITIQSYAEYEDA